MRLGNRTLVLGLLLITSAFSTGAPTKASVDEVADCSAKEPPTDSPHPPGQLWLSITTGVVRPGEHVAIMVEGDLTATATRGVDSYLECWTGREWVTKFVMIVKSDGGLSKPVTRPYPLPRPETIVSLGLSGPGPEPLALPEDLAPGWYRIRKEVSLRGPKVDRRTLHARIRVKV